MGLERPRDRFGRPLRRGADPGTAYPSVPDRTFVSASQAWLEALAYVERGLPFHAHEVFEQRWRCAPQDERALWQALAQWGAALTHDARGNATGARRIAERARSGLDSATIVEPVDADAVTASLSRLLADLA
ncbi:MAG: DUF309 domain-containing protein [Candidatus Nanopelagicales bacterium]